LIARNTIHDHLVDEQGDLFNCVGEHGRGAMELEI
jgi:hypothetical protein